MVVIAQQLHYTKLALAFGNDIGSQTFVQPAIAAIKKAGMTRHHQPDAGPQRVHVPHRGRGDHPVPPAGDPDRGARHRRPHPVRRDQAAQPRQEHPDHRHLGGDLATVLQGRGRGRRREHVRVHLPRRQPGHRDQRARLRAVQGRAAVPAGQGTRHRRQLHHLPERPRRRPPLRRHQPGGAGHADVEERDPSVYGPDIIKIGDGVPGATVCYSFVSCAAALKSGKSIRYEGPGGPTSFDAYHDSTGIFQIDTYSPSGAVNVVGNIRPPSCGPCSLDPHLHASRAGTGHPGVASARDGHHSTARRRRGEPVHRLRRLRPGDRGGARDRRGRLHPPVRRHRRAQPGLRRGHDPGRLPGLLRELPRHLGVVRPAHRGGRLRRGVGGDQQPGVHAVPAARCVADHDGDRVPRHDPDHRVRGGGRGRRRARLLHHGATARRSRQAASS